MRPARDPQLRADVAAVLSMLGLPERAPVTRGHVVATVAAIGVMAAAFPLFGASLVAGTTIFVGGGLVGGVGWMGVGRWSQVRQLVTHGLRGGLSVHETAVTVGGVPSLYGVQFESWIANADRRISDELRMLVGRGGNVQVDDAWTAQARAADQLVGRLVELRESTRAGPLRDRLDVVATEARAVRADVHRLTVVGSAAGDGAAAREAGVRVDELLDSLRTAVDASTRTLVAADRSDGIDTATALQDAATGLLRAHEEVAAIEATPDVPGSTDARGRTTQQDPG